MHQFHYIFQKNHDLINKLDKLQNELIVNVEKHNTLSSAYHEIFIKFNDLLRNHGNL